MENPLSFANGDLRIAYSVCGPEHAPPVVFLHGVSGSRWTWQPIVARLADRYRCYAVDGRGHGGSDRAVHHERAPELVRAVVLEDPPLFMLKPEVFDATPYRDAFAILKENIGAAQAAGKTPEEYAAENARRPIAPGSALTAGDVYTPHALLATARSWLAMDNTMWDAALGGTALDHEEDAPTDVPGRLIRADVGAAFFPEHAVRPARCAPNISVHETPGALHGIHDSREHLEGFVAHVAAVLAEAFGES
ncbi:Alpha/Beta hydrolase protein [Hyaloraphidium curvatum]|nr:Alpha/Beta hydrolase protein [Hyaloraphidium curvatum]